jgi:glutaminyl-tRNA synthetase
MALLEHCVREDLNETAVRVMGVLAPLKLVITNYPEDQTEELRAQNHPQKPELGERAVPFGREVYIEREDFMEEPAKKFFRLAPGREVRLRYAYFIRCEKVVKDEISGEIIELHCTYDPETLGGSAPDGRKVKGTIHWVSAAHGVPAEVRLYDRLFTEENPDAGEADFKTFVNPQSLMVLADCLVEPGLANAQPGSHYQFERQGYFCVDSKDSQDGRPVFNRTVTLRDTWEKEKAKG